MFLFIYALVYFQITGLSLKSDITCSHLPYVPY